MGQTVKLRRSAVAGKKPINSQLELGELSVNTTDGKLFFAKSGSSGPSVQEIITTDTVNTGSVELSGSFVVTGSITGTEFTGSGVGLTNVPLALSGSDAADVSIDGTFTRIKFDESTGIKISGTTGGDATVFLSGVASESNSTEGRTAKLTVTGATSTWTLTHNLNERHPAVEVFDSNDEIIIPQKIEATSDNQIVVTFSTPQTGTVTATVGGGLPTIESGYAGRVLAVNGSGIATWKDTILSGSVDLSSLTTTSSFNTYTSSTNDRVDSLETTSGSHNTRIGNLETESGSIRSDFNSFTSSTNNSFNAMESFTSSIDTTIKNKLNNDGVISGSEQVSITGTTGYNLVDGRLDSLETKTGSLDGDISTLDGRVDSLETTSGSHNTRISNLETTGSDHETRIDGIEVKSGSYEGRLSSLETNSGSQATSISDLETFQTTVETGLEFTGSNVTVKGNLLVKGTETKVNSTTVDIGDNIVSLNGTGATNAGIEVRDTESPGVLSGSLIYDTGDNEWKAGIKGSEETILLSSDKTEIDGRLENLETTGSDHETRIDSIESTSGSHNTRITNLETTGSDHESRIDSIETKTGSLDSDINAITGRTDALETFTSSINTTIKTKLNTEGVISGSEQIDHDATTNFVANEHIDHSTITIGSGKGLTGGGTIETNRSLELATGSNHFLDGVKSKLDSEGVLSGSVQVSITGTTGYNLVDGRLDSLETFTASIDDTYATDSDLTGLTATFNSYTSSNNTTNSNQNSRLDELETKSGSHSTDIENLQIASGSIRSDFNSYTSSNNTTNTNQNSRLDSLETKTGSLDGDISTLDGRVDSLEVKSGSHSTDIENLQIASGSIRSDFNSYTSSNNTTNTTQNSRLSSIETKTGSLDGDISTLDGRVDSLETESGSIRSDFNSYTSSNNTTNTTQNGRLSSIETKTGSLQSDIDGIELVTGSHNTRIGDLETFQTTVETGLEFTGSNVTIKGNLLVRGTETRVNSTTVDIDDNIISLNGTAATNAGIEVRDNTSPGTDSGSLIWDGVNNYWKGGTKSNEERLLDASDKTEIDGRLEDLESTGSAHESRLDTIEAATGSYLTSYNNEYTTGATFNSGNGVITFTRNDGDTFNVDIDGRFLTSYTETDPIFVASPSYGITNTNISNWNTAYGWGDHSVEGYLTSHPNISAASSSDNSGRTYIQDILLDSNGHVTGLTTATETVVNTNYYVDGLSFDTSTGVLTASINGATNQTVDLDGRYLALSGGTLTGGLNGTTGTFSGKGTFDNLELTSGAQHLTFTQSSDDWYIYNEQQDNGIVIYNGTGGVEIHYSGSSIADFDNTGISLRDTVYIRDNHTIEFTNNHITDAKVGQWDTAYGWGDHSTAGYLTSYTESDTLATVTARGAATSESITIQNTLTLAQSNTSAVFSGNSSGNLTIDNNTGSIAFQANGSTVNSLTITSSLITLNENVQANGYIDMGTNSITDTKVGQWDTAYGWGDHSVEGYLTSHPTISAASSSDNSGRTYIQDILLDSNGHVTGITTATESVTNTDEYTTGATFNSGNGIITFTRNDGDTYTVDIDGRFLTSYTESQTLDDVTTLGATTTNTIAVGRVNLGSTVDSDFLTGTSLLSADGYIMTKAIVNTSETGSGPAAIVFGTGSTYGSDRISLVTAGTTRMFIDSNSVDVSLQLNMSADIDMGTNTITDTKVGQWDTAYGWGDHSTAGYLTGHPNISAASSSDNSGRTYIQDILLDGNGHVTGITTATETVTNTDEYTTGVTWNGTTAVLTFTRNDGDTYSVTMLETLSDVTVTGGTYDSSNQTLTLTKSDGNTVDVSGFAIDTDVNYYTTGATFNTGNGIITGTLNNGTTWTVDIDGRFLTSYSETDTLATVTARGSSTTDSITTGNHTISTGTPTLTLDDSNNAGGGGAAGKIIFKNTAGNAIGIGYTADDTSSSDLIISTDASSTYGGYLGLDAGGISDAQADIILDPKTKVQVKGDIDMGTNDITDTKVGEWDTAYGWGDHSTAGYLTSYTETDTLATVTARGATTSDNITTGHHIILSGTHNKQSQHLLYIGGDGLASADASIYIGNDGAGGGYGWELFYEGSGSGNANAFILRAENLGTPVDTMKVLQDGTVTFVNDVSTSADITASGKGTFDHLELTSGARHLTFTQSGDDWFIYNNQQNNGIVLYNGSGGVEIHYSGSSMADFDSTGITLRSSVSTTSTLDVAGWATVGSLLVSNTAPYIDLVDTNSFTDTNDRFRIRAAGNVGQIKWYDDSAGADSLLMTFNPDGTIGVEGDIDMGSNTITDTKVGQWDTAYGWGNHASAGYASSVHTHAATDITSGTFAADRFAVGTRYNIGLIAGSSSQTRDKIRVWDSSTYSIGMKSGYDYGQLGSGEYAMSFQMSNTDGRGWWWGDTGHSDAQGAMSLTTQGKAVIATSLSIGQGESVTSPSDTPLYVEGTTAGDTVFEVQGTSGQLFSITDSLIGDIFEVSDISGIPILTVNSSGVVTVDDTLHVTGDVIAYYASDKRLKDNIKPIENAIDKIKMIGGYEFDWNKNSRNNEGHDIGVIAQEIEEVLPELVGIRSDGYKGVKYEKLTALLIQSNKELIQRVEELEEKLNKSK